jgi:hypothetical protein
VLITDAKTTLTRKGQVIQMPIYSLADVDAALSKPPSPSDHPGKVYGLRVKHPDGTVVLKAGRSNEPPRRTREWRNQCHKDEITLLWEVPTEHATKLGEYSLFLPKT